LEDADAAVSVDSLSAEGWRRKAEAHLALKDHEKATRAAEKGMKAMSTTTVESNATKSAFHSALKDAAALASAPKKKSIKVEKCGNFKTTVGMHCAAENCKKHSALPGVTVLKCKGCLAVHYCSKDCQVSH
jgi:hypothetical protein